MPLLKLAAMAVVTDELLRDTSPDAERVIIDELTRAQAVALDDALVNPSNLGQVDSNGQQVKPASILSGAAQVGGASPTVDANDHLESPRPGKFRSMSQREAGVRPQVCCPGCSRKCAKADCRERGNAK
jgi:Phage capsid family